MAKGSSELLAGTFPSSFLVSSNSFPVSSTILSPVSYMVPQFLLFSQFPVSKNPILSQFLTRYSYDYYKYLDSSSKVSFEMISIIFSLCHYKLSFHYLVLPFLIPIHFQCFYKFFPKYSQSKFLRNVISANYFCRILFISRILLHFIETYTEMPPNIKTRKRKHRKLGMLHLYSKVVRSLSQFSLYVDPSTETESFPGT